MESQSGLFRPGERALMLCALAMAVILGLVLAPVLQQPARAEMVVQSDHLVAMTANSGNEDFLYVIDNRSEELAVYRILNQSSMQMLQRVELPKLFEAARARSTGRK